MRHPLHEIVFFWVPQLTHFSLKLITKIPNVWYDKVISMWILENLLVNISKKGKQGGSGGEQWEWQEMTCFLTQNLFGFGALVYTESLDLYHRALVQHTGAPQAWAPSSHSTQLEAERASMWGKHNSLVCPAGFRRGLEEICLGFCLI